MFIELRVCLTSVLLHAITSSNDSLMSLEFQWNLNQNINVFKTRLRQCLGALRDGFLSIARSKLKLCSANHRPGYWSNLPCDWPSTAWAYSEQETENRPRCQALSWMNDFMEIYWKLPAWVCMSLQASLWNGQSISLLHVFRSSL